MIFQVKALMASGQVVLLRIDAAAEADARREVESRGLSVFMAQPVKSVATLRFGSSAVRVNALGFSQELLMLLRAGLSLVGSLEAMAEKELNVATRAVVEALLQKLRRGGRFSEALVESGGNFPQILIAGVRASERTGSLEETLQRYGEYASRMDEARKKIIAALIYPVMLLIVGLLVSAFLIGFVVPKFAGVYRDSGSEMPWASALLFDMGR
nr:type II secretion system F family protein [Rhodoferax sp.]